MPPPVADFVVVGAGITGATIARVLTDAGYDVLVIERRAHIAGNVHDYTHQSGIRVHSYGPHYFRTSSQRIWNFVNRFTAFNRFEAVVQTYHNGLCEDWPLQEQGITWLCGPDWRKSLWQLEATNFETACLKMVPNDIYKHFIYGYTLKQWGVEPALLSADLAKRFEVRTDGDKRLKKDLHQGLPACGYTGLVQRMLVGIQVLTETDYLGREHEFGAKFKTFFTGPIDEFFHFKHGRLKYRGQKRQTVWHKDVPGYLQMTVQLNIPSLKVDYIRVIEWKHMALARCGHTVTTTETPYTPDAPGDYEYPFPDAVNTRLYDRYRSEAKYYPSTVFCGRLGEYRYYDMDQAIGRALMLAGKILSEDL